MPIAVAKPSRMVFSARASPLNQSAKRCHTLPARRTASRAAARAGRVGSRSRERRTAGKIAREKRSASPEAFDEHQARQRLAVVDLAPPDHLQHLPPPHLLELQELVRSPILPAGREPLGQEQMDPLVG